MAVDATDSGVSLSQTLSSTHFGVPSRSQQLAGVLRSKVRVLVDASVVTVAIATTTSNSLNRLSFTSTPGSKCI
ncbi:hypothetical protein [Oscillatoria sp. FACHB-1407]|uniref:hypothetical protein n=1 Tax=Oscillatoria sp. FACHB-1407 TaxID=2692847 RepID=UPI0016846855|nr:hypothetical protein [Oscillatoria sp. FACHB-1407]